MLSRGTSRGDSLRPRLTTQVTPSKEGYAEQSRSRPGRLQVAPEPMPKNETVGNSPEPTILPHKPFQMDFVVARKS